MSDALAGLLDGYQTPIGVADELRDATGAMRPVWADFIAHLQTLTPDGAAQRFQRGAQYLRDAGVFYHKYGADSASERDWPFSPIPVLLSAEDWDQISQGLIQRAELLERIVADLYGPATLVRDGYLPPDVIARNPAWLRPMVGVKPRGGSFLNVLAFEVGRGPTGQWWVLGDRTDAPSGAGFALENRVATTRVFPNFYARAHVQRLAGFFQAFRAHLSSLRLDPNEPIGLMTPGQMNDGFFEHTYLARYLGFLLVEGEDMVVADGRLQVRTVEGLRPISVLWRRLDAAFVDPLELQEDSALGTPGMLEMIRAGRLTTVNAPGAGVLESRSLMAFLPQLADHVLGAPLHLPNIATWWCGEARKRAEVLAQGDKITIASAHGSRLQHEDPNDHHSLPTDPQARARYLEQHGADLVGQERVTLSTTPVWQDNRLVPKAMSLRVFLARTEQGWRVMPGGYARIGTGPKDGGLGMQAGGSVSDVWVISADAKRSLLTPSLMPPGETVTLQGTALPARAADNLFWLGRYIERSEGAMRAFRAYFGLRGLGVSETDPLALLLQQDVLGSASSGAGHLARAFEDPIAAAETCAARIRDRFSVDGFLALKDLAATARDLSAKPIPLEDVPQTTGILLRKVTGFAGLVHENMYRSTDWRFLSLGLSLERAAAMAGLLARVLPDDAPEGALDLALELGDSVMAHRARYSSAPNPATVSALLAQDARNPRAILYHVARARDQIGALPGPMGGACARLVTEIDASLRRPSIGAFGAGALLDLRMQIWSLCDLIGSTYLRGTGGTDG